MDRTTRGREGGPRPVAAKLEDRTSQSRRLGKGLLPFGNEIARVAALYERRIIRGRRSEGAAASQTHGSAVLLASLYGKNAQPEQAPRQPIEDGRQTNARLSSFETILLRRPGSGETAFIRATRRAPVPSEGVEKTSLVLAALPLRQKRAPLFPNVHRPQARSWRFRRHGTGENPDHSNPPRAASHQSFRQRRAIAVLPRHRS